jgi:hypothetical protein
MNSNIDFCCLKILIRNSIALSINADSACNSPFPFHAIVTVVDVVYRLSSSALFRLHLSVYGCGKFLLLYALAMQLMLISSELLAIDCQQFMALHI